MTNNTEPLLELIDKAEKLAAQEQRPVVAYLLHMAADEAVHGKLGVPNAIQPHAEKRRRRRRWRWSPKLAHETQH
jgi:hypothetical protein